MKANGTFEVKLQGEPPHHDKDGVMLSRASLDKRFSGALDAHGTGQMLAARTPVAGSAAYVAIEHIDGKLDGRSGSFVAAHHGVMAAGANTLSIAIVPDSGTGELAGIAGTMSITIEGGKHFYSIDYTLPNVDG